MPLHRPDPEPEQSHNPESGYYLSADQVAARVGVTTRRLGILLQRHQLTYRGSIRDPFFLEADLPSIFATARGAAPADELTGMTPLAGKTSATNDWNGNSVDLGQVEPFKVNRLIQGHALAELRKMPRDIVQCVVTSPPFWGQRVYADETPVEWADGKEEVAFGRESTPEEYVAHCVEVLGELGRVLKPRGTIWWNIGDSYLTRTILHGNSSDRILRYGGQRASWADATEKRHSSGHEYLKDKDLTLVPFLTAIGAQHLGLWLRSVVVWSKQQPSQDTSEEGLPEIRTHMPEPVSDRPVTGHEYIVLFAKDDRYDYHAENLTDLNGDATSLNVRTVWTFRPADKGGNHGARFPSELPRRCISLGTNPGELVLDPFAGHATTLRVAASMKRDYIGIEISPTYVEEARTGLSQLTLETASSSEGSTPQGQ